MTQDKKWWFKNTPEAFLIKREVERVLDLLTIEQRDYWSRYGRWDCYCKASVREKVNREQELTLFAKYKLKHKLTFKIQSLFRLISQKYIELTARDHYWLCFLPSARQHPAVTQSVTSAQEKCWRATCPRQVKQDSLPWRWEARGRPLGKAAAKTPLQRLQRKQQYSWGILFQIKWMLKVKNRQRGRKGKAEQKNNRRYEGICSKRKKTVIKSVTW